MYSTVLQDRFKILRYSLTRACNQTCIKIRWGKRLGRKFREDYETVYGIALALTHTAVLQGPSAQQSHGPWAAQTVPAPQLPLCPLHTWNKQYSYDHKTTFIPHHSSIHIQNVRHLSLDTEKISRGVLSWWMVFFSQNIVLLLMWHNTVLLKMVWATSEKPSVSGDSQGQCQNYVDKWSLVYKYSHSIHKKFPQPRTQVFDHWEGATHFFFFIENKELKRKKKRKRWAETKRHTCSHRSISFSWSTMKKCFI